MPPGCLRALAAPGDGSFLVFDLQQHYYTGAGRGRARGNRQPQSALLPLALVDRAGLARRGDDVLFDPELRVFRRSDSSAKPGVVIPAYGVVFSERLYTLV